MTNSTSHALRLDDVHLSRGTGADARAILAGANLCVDAGTTSVLMGASGAGKSTVLRAIAALEPFDAGSIQVGDFILRPGRVPPQSALRILRSRVGMVFQAHALFEHLTVLDNLTLAPVHALGWSRDRARDVAYTMLQQLGIAGRADALPGQISGGEAQRTAIARALVLDPEFLLLDEPTAALDPDRRAGLAATLRALSEQGRGLLISTHDADFARSVADRTHVLESGAIRDA
jgi:ABC-type polar amino acid transport system ATPase subunit